MTQQTEVCYADCVREVYCKGLCLAHYYRMSRNGDDFDRSPVNERGTTDEQGRECNNCLEYKPWSEFYRTKKTGQVNNREARCKLCQGVSKRAARYGATEEEILSLLSDAGGTCTICNNRFDNSRRAVVDHCHDSGNVRGIICVKCNAGLGQFDDSPDSLREAIRYLNENN